MGWTIIEATADRDDIEVVVGFGVGDAEEIRGVPIVNAEDTVTGLAEFEPEVVDFTVPAASVAFAEECADVGVSIVVSATASIRVTW